MRLTAPRSFSAWVISSINRSLSDKFPGILWRGSSSWAFSTLGMAICCGTKLPVSCRVSTCSPPTIQDGLFCTRAPTDPCETLSPNKDRWYIPCAVVDTSLSAPRPAALDISLKMFWVLVAGERRVLVVDSAPPRTLVALGLPFFLGPPDPSSSLFLSSGHRTIIVLGFIPLTTSLPEGSRRSRLKCGHRGQRFGRRCQVAGLYKIPRGRISRRIVSGGTYRRNQGARGIEKWADT
jgi:hypothetical protein